MTKYHQYPVYLDSIKDSTLKNKVRATLQSILSDSSYRDFDAYFIAVCDDETELNSLLPVYNYIIALGSISSDSEKVFTIEVNSHLKSNLSSALKFLLKQPLNELNSNDYSSYMDTISDILFSLNKDGFFTKLNKSFESILGIERAEILGKHFSELIHEDDLALANEKFIDLVELQIGQNIDLRVRKSNGTYVALEVKTTPLLRSGNMEEINGIARDITKRKNLEEACRQSQSQYENLLNSIRDIVIVFDLHWKCIFANEISKQYLMSNGNQTKPEGQTLFQIFPGILNTEMYSILENVMHSRNPDSVVVNTKIFDGKDRWFNFGIYPAEDGLLCLARDITGTKVLEGALQNNRDNMKSTLMSMDDLVYVLDKNNIFVDIYTPDKTHKYLPGPEDCLGRAMHDTMPPDLASAFSKYIDAARSKRRAMDYIFFIDKYGKRKWFSSRFTARRGNDSEYLGTTVVIRDITESQQFKEELIASENKFRTVVNQLVDGLLVFNTQGKIVDTNPALGKILRVAANKLLNKDIWDILSLVKFVPADYELSSEQLKTFFIDYRAHSRSTKQLMQFDLHLKDDKNKDLFLKLFLFPFETNSDFLFAAILRDVSKRVLVEQEIKSLNMELENRVKERTAQLEEAFQDLRLEILRREGIESDLIATKEDLAKALNTERDLNEIKNKFITMISHQYRTPITVISSSLELMNEHFKKGNQERFDKHSQKIKKAINTLIQLLENVTAFQSSNDGKLSAILIELNLEKILWKIIDEITIYDNDSHRLTFVYDSKDTVVKSDPKLLYMIFNNLLLNSLKFSPANTEIKILVSSDSKYYFIEIEDKGIGISEQELQVIFDPFIRSEKVSPTMGSGLGLTIVQRCLDLLGGRIKIQSEPNKYTKVLVRLNK